MNITIETKEKAKRLDRVHVTWRDYALMLLNSTADPLRSIWHEKVMTSYEHWKFKEGSISEVNVNGLEVLSELPSAFTEYLVDDSYAMDGEFSWQKLGRLAGSKRMKIRVGGYPQESLSNEAYLCAKYCMQHADEPVPGEWIQSAINDGMAIQRVNFGTFDESEGRALRMSDMLLSSYSMRMALMLACMSGGEGLTQDEILTYILEKPVRDSKHGAWVLPMFDVCLHGIPSNQFKKYWKSDAIHGFPLDVKGEYKDEIKELLESACWEPDDERFSLDDLYERFDQVWDVWVRGCDLPVEAKWERLDTFLRERLLREDVAYSPCWKKICICVLKNDVSFKYCGFGATLRERQAREEAMAAFSTNQEQKKKAAEDAKALAEQIEKENRSDRR